GVVPLRDSPTILTTAAIWSLGRKQDKWHLPSSWMLGFRAVTIDLSDIRKTASSISCDEGACITTLRNVVFFRPVQSKKTRAWTKTSSKFCNRLSHSA